ncbi:MAG TPA: hypothetical protein PLR20_15855 [Syntrophales bacterium]|nr:hypothetical protein [Syntrophales bacterium]HPI57156.1 hypothetical protein [Syntrophales bacterium]HPN24757.1 hypothetical protein [Syntrophales bacterium]HQM30825.1 hypothetical protein [Syntrophales bacterium]
MDRADAEGDRDVTPVEDSAYATLEARLEKVEKGIERETKLSKIEADVNEPRKKYTHALFVSGRKDEGKAFFGFIKPKWSDLFPNGKRSGFRVLLRQVGSPTESGQNKSRAISDPALTEFSVIL